MRTPGNRGAAAIAALTLLIVTASFAPATAVAPATSTQSMSASPAGSASHAPVTAPTASASPTPGTASTVAAGPAADLLDTGDEGATDDVGATEAVGRGNRTLSLVTGHALAVTRRGERLTARRLDGGPLRVVRVAGRTYAFPGDVDLSTYDRSLFDLETLLARSPGEPLPVLVEADDPDAVANVSGLRDVRHLRSAGVVAADLDPDAAAPALGELARDGRVEGVSLDRRYDRPPSSPATAVPTGIDANRTGAGVTVAVLDSGIDSTHPALNGTVVDRVDLVDGNASEGLLDPNGHGTVVAGVVAGRGNASGEGSRRGVAPGASLVDVRVMDERGRGHASTIVEGIEYAVDAEVDVIQLSVGSSVDGSEAVAEAVEWATDRGVVVVSAAGNLGRPRSIGAAGRPAGAITVGAADGGGVAPYSSRGPTLNGRLKPDLLAPVGDVVGPIAAGSGRVPTAEGGSYTRMAGTSAAAPQVAGVAALLLAREPGLSARAVENRLVSAARPLPDVATNAQGGGVLDVERALDPAIVADPAVLDLGLVASEGPRNRTIRLSNRDGRRHDLELEATARNVDLDRPAGDAVALNRSTLSLAPGESVALRLTIDGDVRPGSYAGAISYAVGGEPRSLPFGFTRGGHVTVEKRPLTPGDRVDGDEVWVLNDAGTHDELLAVENGSASFVAGGGTYVVWSGGVDGATGTTVLLSERRRFDANATVVLDERETVPVGVDASRLADRHGPLANRSVTVSMSTPFGDGLARRSVERRNVPSRAVRVSADPGVDVATEFLLATEADSPAALDATDVFHLVHAVEGVREPDVLEVGPGRLETTTYRYHRATLDETYRVQPRARIHGVWNERTFRWYALGDRAVQRVHRVPAAASYGRSLSGPGWFARRPRAPDRSGPLDLLSHPMVGRLDVAPGPGENWTVSAAPFVDDAGTTVDPTGADTLTVLADGRVVMEVPIRGGSGSPDGVAARPGEGLTVRLEGNASRGFLSTRTITEVSLAGEGPRGGIYSLLDGGPPTITGLAVPAANATNAVAPGPLPVTVDADVTGPVADPVVWYSTTSPSTPPWRNDSAWRRVEPTATDGRLHATVPVDAEAETVSLAAAVGDAWGRRARTMTADAVHVGRAPNTSTSAVLGRLLAADGSPAANDTVYLAPVDGGPFEPVRTDDAGRFTAEVPRGREYDLRYARGAPWTVGTDRGSGLPAWQPLRRISTAEDVDLGTRRLPRARVLNVTVTDERGEPVAGAAVEVGRTAGNVTVTERLRTGADGRARRAGRSTPGIQLSGPVRVRVVPPDRDVYSTESHRFDVALDGPTERRVTLNTTPPVAALTAMGPFGPRDVVLLQAWDSDVPAGADEYRWDFDGDGVVEAVTSRPIARFRLSEGSRRPRVIVVDRAGKRDAASLVLPDEGT